MNEWEFTADIASWINIAIDRNPELPFSAAKCEQRGRGSRKRRDLTLLDKNQRVVLTGEIKLPFRADGSSPYMTELVKDAWSKARRAESRFFFTWNVNEFVLWETTDKRVDWQERNYKSWDVTSVHRDSHLDLPMTHHAIQTWLPEFLHSFAAILRGTADIGRKSPDVKFIEALESSLYIPIIQNFEELRGRYEKPRFKSKLDMWMREEQGWIILDDLEGIRDNLERTSKFACYALVNKLVFYEALLKRHGHKMDKIFIPEHIDTGDALRLHLEKSFKVAKSATNDYETVFGEEHKSIGNLIPFYSDKAVHHWRQLINQIHEFDFSKLDYEIIGNIFERLISPEERHKYGQFYTRVEVVDLINSFCIRRGDEKIMDPACGGGTFLVRAYVRKRELDPTRSHGQLLSDIYGVDVSYFATHLTTINLATRDLVDAENYPQIARCDFFDTDSAGAFVTLPRVLHSKGVDQKKRVVSIQSLDAVISNPPYVRQEDIPKSKRKGKNGPERGTKDYYQWLVKLEAGAKLSGRSDIHCYFWPHAASFLKSDGYLCFLTSSQWLDVEYGFDLQRWILRNFRVVAVFESVHEPWFIGARVSTIVTILQRETVEKQRMNNIVRFVQLRRPIGDVLSHAGLLAEIMESVDQFRDEILNLRKNASNERYRARVVRQGDLWKQGVQLGVIMGVSNDAGNDDPESEAGDYFGGKWGLYLRAPELWFTLLDGYGGSLAPLGNITQIRRGITSGSDCFFFPKDCSLDCLSKTESALDFKQFHGVARTDVVSGRIKLVKCGKGLSKVMPIESMYLEPEVHTLMNVDRFVVTADESSRLVLLVGKKQGDLKGTHVLEYVKWGEKENYHRKPTSSARTSQDREWYDLTGQERSSVLWPKARQYRHIAAENVDKLLANCSLYHVSPPDGLDDTDLWGGLLNSTWVLMSALQFGRPVGNEGHFSTMVSEVKMMLVPDPRKGTRQQLEKIGESFRKMKNRKALQFLSEHRLRQMAYVDAGKEDELNKLSDVTELDMADRRTLDDAVLQMLGVKPKKRRDELIDELYSYLREFFELTRRKEEIAITNKKRSRRRATARPEDIAQQIYQEILDNEGRLLLDYDEHFMDTSKPYDVFEIPAEGSPQSYTDMFIANGVQFRRGKKKRTTLIETKNAAQDELIVLLVNSGVRDLVRIPHEEDECMRVFTEYGRFVRRRDQRFRELIEERTVDEEMQKKILRALMPLVLAHK